MKKRVTYIDGLKLGQHHALNLLKLVDEKITESNNRDTRKDENWPAPQKLKDFNSFSSVRKQILKYLAQWDNVYLGDKVEYRPKLVVMADLFKTDKPDPQ